MPTPLVTYLRLQRAQDREILAHLRSADAAVTSELRRLQGRAGVGNAVRADQLRISQAAINRQMSTLWAKVGDTIEAHKAEAAASGAEAMLDDSTLARILPEESRDLLLRASKAQAVQNLRVAEERLSGSSYVPLAESVYHNEALSTGKVDQIVTDALARGASAKELADAVKDYVNPNTPGGVKYASMRLGRTELNNAFHASQIRQAQESPWITAVLWNLSGSHPIPDECNDYADKVHFKGGEAGQFRPEDIPAKPHPNCLCYTSTVDVGVDEFVKQFQSGAYDDHLKDLGMADTTVQEAHATVRAAEQVKPLSGMDAHSKMAGRYSGWMDKTSSEIEKTAFDRYTRVDAYKRWNPHMRGQASDIDDTDVEQIEALTNLIRRSPPLESPVATYRGIKDPSLVFGSDSMPEGTIFKDNAFISTTMDDGIRDYYQGEGGAVVNIRIPEGTRAAVAETEGQIVLSPGTSMRIISDRLERTVKDQEGYQMLLDDAKTKGWTDEQLETQLVRWKVVEFTRVIEAEVI